jgi:hypothetical protein
MSYNSHAEFRELWGRYFFAKNIKGVLDILSNFDFTLDTENPNLSFFTVRSLLYFQIGDGWFADIGPAYRGDFASNYKYREIRLIGSVHYIKKIEDWSFRNRFRFEQRWINEGPSNNLERNDSLRLRLRTLIQKNHLIKIDRKLSLHAGPEFFFEQNSIRGNRLGLRSIRWIFALGRLVTETLSIELDYWHRQYMEQEVPNFGSLLLRVDQVF